MGINTSAVYTARLDVPFAAGDEEVKIVTQVSPERRYTFSATSTVSEADARRKVRDFLQAARDAAQT